MGLQKQNEALKKRLNDCCTDAVPLATEVTFKIHQKSNKVHFQTTLGRISELLLMLWHGNGCDCFPRPASCQPGD